MFYKDYAKFALSKRGIQVHRRPGLIGFIQSRNIDLVIDVGANTGQFGSELRFLGYNGNIISFEPVKNVFDILHNRTKHDNQWEARQVALGDTAGERSINVSKSSVYSSFLAQKELAKSFDPLTEIFDVEVVRVERLDDVCNQIVGHRTFLKIDTQGFEKSVLAGAARLLQIIDGVQLELSVEHLYEDNWDIEEAISFMRFSGYIIAQVNVVSSIREDPASVLELDCIFRRISV